MESLLGIIVVLLAVSVGVVTAARALKLPPLVGYLMVGLVLGPHALALAPDTDVTRWLAEIGVVFLMFSIGLFASWLGTLCWNEASQRLPPSLVGQLIVFETLAALSYAWVLRERWPDGFTLAGAALLVAGVAWALRSGAPSEG